MDPDAADIMELITKAPWREAVTYRDTWPHEYVVIQKDAQQELLAAFCERILRGEGVECHFFHQTRPYLFLGNYKYWVMDETEGIYPETYDSVLNRALLYRDHRDFVIQQGDTGMRGEDAMAATEEGIEQVDVRKKWLHEAHHFTPWLAENLELLGEAIGLKLELVQREKLIGSLWLDILAKEAESGALVAIENQLEWTDIDHLDRLFIYAAGCEARVAIWVAPEFIHEHAQVLHQMNEWSGSNASFYGVKIEVLQRTEGSPMTPRFRKVVYPGGWDKTLTQPQVFHPYRDFFEGLIVALRAKESGFADGPRQRFDYRDRLSPSRIDPGVGYAISFWKSDAWVYLHIDTNDHTEGMFDTLKADRQEIESAVHAFPEQEWWWRRSSTFSAIGVCKAASIDDPPELLEETRQWMLDLLPKFKEIFEPRVERLLGKLRQ